MLKLTGLLICLLLSAQVLSQSTCSVSSLSGIASGIITLGSPGKLAETSYSKSLSGFNLGLYA